jgi:hypothetical protein
MGAPSGSADVSAIGRVRAFLAGWLGLGVGFGSRVGNRPAALPPGFSVLRVGLTAGMLGRLPTGSGEVTVAGTGSAAAGTCGAAACGGIAEVCDPVVRADAVMEIAADALGAFAR